MTRTARLALVLAAALGLVTLGPGAGLLSAEEPAPAEPEKK